MIFMALGLPWFTIGGHRHQRWEKSSIPMGPQQGPQVLVSAVLVSCTPASLRSGTEIPWMSLERQGVS